MGTRPRVSWLPETPSCKLLATPSASIFGEMALALLSPSRPRTGANTLAWFYPVEWAHDTGPVYQGSDNWAVASILVTVTALHSAAECDLSFWIGGPSMGSGTPSTIQPVTLLLGLGALGLRPRRSGLCLCFSFMVSLSCLSVCLSPPSVVGTAGKPCTVLGRCCAGSRPPPSLRGDFCSDFLCSLSGLTAVFLEIEVCVFQGLLWRRRLYLLWVGGGLRLPLALWSCHCPLLVCICAFQSHLCHPPAMCILGSPCGEGVHPVPGSHSIGRGWSPESRLEGQLGESWFFLG